MARDFQSALNVPSPRSVLPKKVGDLLFVIEKSRQGGEHEVVDLCGRNPDLCIRTRGSSARTIGLYVVAMAFAMFSRVA